MKEVEMGNVLKLYGTPANPEAHELRDFLHRNAYPFEWYPVSDDSRDNGDDLPVCELPNGTRLSRPSTRSLSEALGWFHTPRCQEYDLAIYGAGPAGLSAAVYAASEGLRTLLIEKLAMGGQAGSTSCIENYLGFPNGISGWELASRAREQAQRLGAEILLTGDGATGTSEDGWCISRLKSGETIRAQATICATGVEYNRLGLPNEEDFIGRGFFYGAGASEANLCKGHVFVIGGGNSAAQACLYFAARTERVTLLTRGSKLSDTLSAYLLDRIRHCDNIDVRESTVVKELIGNHSVSQIVIKNTVSGEETTESTEWVFCCIGGTPRTSWAAPGALLTDERGYILTGMELDGLQLPAGMWSAKRRPMNMETSMPGLFAAGDVRHDSVKRCATAVGDGAAAVSMVHKYLSLTRAERMAC